MLYLIHTESRSSSLHLSTAACFFSGTIQETYIELVARVSGWQFICLPIWRHRLSPQPSPGACRHSSMTWHQAARESSESSHQVSLTSGLVLSTVKFQSPPSISHRKTFHSLSPKWLTLSPKAKWWGENQQLFQIVKTLFFIKKRCDS